MKIPVVPLEAIIDPGRPQHMSALENANRIRLARARAKNDLHAGVITLAEALELECLQTATITAVLESMERWGHIRAERVCRQIPCSSYRRVGELTERQRAQLVRLVAETNPNTITDAA